jgi:hypothetical protein
MAFPTFNEMDARVLFLDADYEYLYNPDTGYVFDMDTKAFIGTFMPEDEDSDNEDEVEYIFIRYEPPACTPLFDTPEFWKKHKMVTKSKIAQYRKAKLDDLKLRNRAGVEAEWNGMLFDFVFEDDFSTEHYIP